MHNYYLCLTLGLLISINTHGVDQDYCGKARPEKGLVHTFPSVQIMRARGLTSLVPVADATVPKTDATCFAVSADSDSMTVKSKKIIQFLRWFAHQQHKANTRMITYAPHRSPFSTNVRAIIEDLDKPQRTVMLEFDNTLTTAAPVSDTTVFKTGDKGFVHYSSGAYTASFNSSLGEYSASKLMCNNEWFGYVNMNSVEAKEIFFRLQSSYEPRETK